MYSLIGNRLVHEQMVREAMERKHLRAELRAARRGTQGGLWRQMIVSLAHRREPHEHLTAINEGRDLRAA